MTDYCIAWWNLENLFDVAGAQEPHRPEYLRKQLASELKGWTQSVLNRKLSQLASVIVRLNGGRGPDILGCCEIENKRVMLALAARLNLPGRNYDVVHHHMRDKRGIDIAFIYDRGLFRSERWFSHEILKRSATRDLFQVNFRTPEGRLLILIGNHWPSRLGGVYESEPYRILAAETLSYWLSRVQEIHGEEVPVLIMGDFNDPPSSRALREYALSTHYLPRVTNARIPRLYNLMGPLAGQGMGTHFYSGEPDMLDQFLATEGMVKRGMPIRVQADSVEIIAWPEMRTSARKPAPLRFGRPSKPSSYNRDGFSDHFPITVRVTERPQD
jgi:hypothetical protein